MSKIEVNQIGPQCGTTLTVGCGAGQTVNIDANTVTLGRCGATVSLAAGATQSGFGRTGTVDWDTTAKTTTVNAASGNGYFINTTSGAITVNLPAGSAGDIVSLADYAATWQTNNVTVTPNGTDKIGGVNASVTLNTEGQSVTFVYTDSTQGWLNTMDSTSNVRGNAYIVATGGTETTCGDYKIHTFTGPGTFTVSATAICAADNNVDYLVVAGGGGGGGAYGGGGGAGGYRESSGTASGCYTVSPLGACVSALPVSVTAYPITVGGGGNKGPLSPSGPGTNGSNSVFSTITSTGGGAGGGDAPPAALSNPGGSGGGGGNNKAGATGNTPPVNPPQGNDGGGVFNSGASGGNGGGGATVAGTPAINAVGPNYSGGPGGNGATSSINGTPTARGGGGGGGLRNSGTAAGSGGTGGGGAGSGGTPPATAGTTNTGGGGGGGSGDFSPNGCGANGGSGIVIIRYKYQ